MDTAEGSDLAKVQARRERHKARGVNGNGFGESLSEKAQTTTDLWMAPNVPNGGRSTAHAEQIGATLYHEGKKVQMGLESQTQNWPSPMAGAAGTDDYNAAGNSDFSRKAMELADDLLKNWPGPQARDFRSGESQKSDEELWGTKGLPLERVATQHFRPPSSPDHPTIAGGSTSSTAGPNSNQPSVKRRLNPIFVEALMRWPTGLSGFERQEMALTRWRQQQLSFLSALFSRDQNSEIRQGSLL